MAIYKLKDSPNVTQQVSGQVIQKSKPWHRPPDVLLTRNLGQAGSPFSA